MKDFKISVRFGNSSQNISRYYSEVSKQKMLTPEEEAELAVLAKEGDQKAKEKIVTANLKFAISVAKFYNIPSCPLEDLISEANKGLVEAIESYDPTTGFKFISYAVWHIRKNIMLYISNFSRMVRIPGNIQAAMRNHQKVVDHFIQNNGREPDIHEAAELMEKFGMPALTKRTLDVIQNKPVSIALDPISNPNTDDERMIPINYIESEEKTDFLLIDNDKKEIIKNLVSCLKPVERSAIEMKYGLLSEKMPLSYKEIGENFDRTSEWARQTISKAEKKMKLMAKKKKMKNWIA